jgi:hypothetical protein
MPWSLKLDGGIVIATCSGVLGSADARAGAVEFWANEDYRGKPVVWDFRSAELDFKAADVRALADFVLDRQPSPPPSRVAFVTARDADFGFVRMFEVFREHPSTRVRVFRVYDEAVDWARTG